MAIGYHLFPLLEMKILILILVPTYICSILSDMLNGNEKIFSVCKKDVYQSRCFRSGTPQTPGILTMCSFGLFNRYMYYLLKNDLQSILGKETKS